MRAMHIVPGVLLLILAVSMAEAVELSDSLGIAVLNRDVMVSGEDGAPLAVPDRGEVLICTSIKRMGCRVLYHDSEGLPRSAFLPFRDRWGRATARLWIHDGYLAENTVRTLRTVVLQPVDLCLKRGSVYPVVLVDRNQCFIRYIQSGYARFLPIPRTSVELEMLADHSLPELLGDTAGDTAGDGAGESQEETDDKDSPEENDLEEDKLSVKDKAVNGS